MRCVCHATSCPWSDSGHCTGAGDKVPVGLLWSGHLDYTGGELMLDNNIKVNHERITKAVLNAEKKLLLFCYD